MQKPFLAIATLAIAVGGFAIAAASMASSPSERREKLLSAYQPSGKAVSCIQLHSIRDTKVIDNRTIDFRTNGGKVYRNTLSSNCPGLVSQDAFSYRTSMSSLCSVDIIRVLHNYGGRLEEGAGCGLGKFQPMTKVGAAR
jgi:Family of unknown function (DUF6491)